jgi:hypothetical protein
MRGLSLLGTVAVVCLATACSSSQDVDPVETAPPDETALEIAPPPLPPPPVDLSLGDLAMRRPIVDGRLSIVPIVMTATSPTPARDYLTLADAMKRGVAQVRITTPSMLDLTVENDSKQPLFVYAGELLDDGMQDRVLSASVIIEPGESEVVPARCVEELRSTGGWGYTATRLIGDVDLRREVYKGDENTVWRRVDAVNAKLELAPPTHSHLPAAHQLDRANRARRDRLVDALTAVAKDDRVIGAAVAIDGRVVAIDRFDSPSLFAALSAQLVGSYLASEDLTPVYRDVEGRPRTLTPDDVRAFAVGGDTVATVASTTTLRPY